MRFKAICAPLVLALAIAMGGCRGETATNASAENAAEATAGEVSLLIRAKGGQEHRFMVEVAVDDVSQQRGLMGRTSLADDKGMLFPFPFPNMASFWMKDTPLPLDLIFIRPDGTIAGIFQGKPNDLHPISAGEAVSAVLEIKQGRAKALGIVAEDRVQWGDCDGAPPKAAWQADRFCPAAAN